MKAIVCTKYGSPEVLQLKEVEKPTPKEEEALVKVHASSLNAADLEYLRGVLVVRLLYQGLLKPKNTIPGSDVAGRIEAVGRNVKHFQPGDEIWGDLSYPLAFGTLAEYVCIPENALRLKPTSMTFEEAAAAPTAALVALQNLRDKREIQPGQKVLINGAGGGTGTFAVQLAKYFGAEVTGVDSAKKLDMLRSIGVDHVIDYTQEDFSKNGQHYDLIIDVVVHRWIFDYKRALSPKGMCVFVGGSMTRIFLNVFLGRLISMTSSKKMALVPWTGKVKPVIDKRYPLSEAAEAFRYLEEGHAQGKIVITM